MKRLKERNRMSGGTELVLPSCALAAQSTMLECSPVGAYRRDDTSGRLVGVYEFAHPNGVFEVHLRPGGRFFAPNFPSKASAWKCDNSCCADGPCQLLIEWGKYGQYALDIDTAAVPLCCSGSVKGDLQQWRKVSVLSAFQH